jgi:hypothetical protein
MGNYPKQVTFKKDTGSPQSHTQYGTDNLNSNPGSATY